MIYIIIAVELAGYLSFRNLKWIDFIFVNYIHNQYLIIITTEIFNYYHGHLKLTHFTAAGRHELLMVNYIRSFMMYAVSLALSERFKV